MSESSRPLQRRTFLVKTLRTGALVGVGSMLPARVTRGAHGNGTLHVGEGVVDTTPPLGIELAGFHRADGNERRVRGIRQPTSARALVLRHGGVHVAIVSLEIAGFANDLAQRVQKRVAARIGIPAANVRVCATHTHSMPAFFYLRQWGGIPKEYMASVETMAVEAVERAEADAAPAALFLGKCPAAGGNHNRTVKVFKTDAQFTADATDAERWLDTMVHVLYFDRAGGKRNLLWYHFSAHPVCYADELAGPDWPGLVDQRLRASHNLAPAFLQGHCGDVNPGSGTPWRGDADQTADAVHTALAKAMVAPVQVEVDRLRLRTELFAVPFDIALFKNWLAQYRTAPEKCTQGAWVDAGFAQDWFAGNVRRDLHQAHLPVTLAALQIGSVGMVFHPAELYSYYGLAIRRDSPLPDTIVVGYTDGLIGYLADPPAYVAGEYAATVVPKILDYPPFTPTAARDLAQHVQGLLRQTVA